MFGPKDRLGFTEDDLDRSTEALRRNDKLRDVRNGVLVINIALSVIVVPVFVALLVQAVRSNAADRWTTFWIGSAIILAIALVVEIFLVTRLLRSAKDAPGVFTGDERA